MTSKWLKTLKKQLKRGFQGPENPFEETPFKMSILHFLTQKYPKIAKNDQKTSKNDTFLIEILNQA